MNELMNKQSNKQKKEQNIHSREKNTITLHKEIVKNRVRNSYHK